MEKDHSLELLKKTKVKFYSNEANNFYEINDVSYLNFDLISEMICHVVQYPPKSYSRWI